MYFESFSALLMMDGHGPYVWACVVLTIIVLLSLIISPLQKKRRFMVEQRMRLRREKAQTGR